VAFERLFFPGLAVGTLIPAGDAIIHMRIRGSAERQVIQAGQAHAFPQVLIEGVEGLKVRG
jgi:hypothetical protein